MPSQYSNLQRAGLAGLVVLTCGAAAWIGRQRSRSVPTLEIQHTAPGVVAPEADIEVDVTGAVNKPGVVHLHPGERIEDAVAKAGGAKPTADLNQVNLAAKPQDGEQILVPTRESEERAAASPTSHGKGRKSSGRTASKKGDSAVMVSLNTATEDQLESLPGVGPATAERILDYRKEHGGFGSVDELRAVKGIGPKKLEAIRKHARV